MLRTNSNIEELFIKIKEVARKKNAIILAHNYQIPEVQDVADLTGDSLALAMQASKTDADIIVFCGVHFMAEAASVVCPEKRVIMPVAEAGCAMADMISAEQLRGFKAEHPGVPVVTYINSSAEVKAESDICCTSANAVQVVKSIKSREVIMTPDKNLAAWTQMHTDQKIWSYNGCCPIHDNLTIEEVNLALKEHPEAVLMAHPECPSDVLKKADVVKSTSGMLDYASTSHEEEFIVATETGLIYTLEKANPEKKFYPASSKMLCSDMKKTGLKEILKALEDETPVIKVKSDIAFKAMRAVKRMMEVPRD